MRARVVFLGMVFVVLAFGCSGLGTPTAGVEPTAYVPSTAVPTAGAATGVPGGDIVGEAIVDSIEILILESFPVQVNVVASGNLPDGCTTIDQVEKERDGNTFRVTITTIRPADMACTEALVPFEEVISLDVYGLPAGTYTVEVNGVSDTFELAVDNVAPVLGAIRGKVWHDLCRVPYESVDTPPEGCVRLPGGGLAANGVLEAAEPGIEGVLVDLGAGACPSTGLATTTTDSEGYYAFLSLSAGTYCVSVNALNATNETILIPGSWTYPNEEGSVTIALGEGEERMDVNFGWDYQFLP